MRHASRWAACVLPAMLLAAGCQKLNYSKTVTLEGGAVNSTTIDAPQSEQKIRVTAQSSAGPIDAYVVLEKDQTAVENALQLEKPPAKDKVLASQEKTKDVNLEATIPAHNGYAVILAGSHKKTTVALSVKSE